MYPQNILNGIPNIIRESSNGFSPISIHDDLYQKRFILCTESITKEYIDSLVFQLLQLDRLNHDEITIYINSYGGEVMAGLMLYDVMNLIKSPIKTVCMGSAFSMAGILFICGDKREMLPHSKIMLHEPLISQLSQKNASEFEEITRDLLQTKKCLAEIVAQKSDKSVDEILEIFKNEKFYSAEEALELGFCDKILEKRSK